MTVRRSQAAASIALGRAQQGRRSSVTAGAHLRGVDQVIAAEIGSVYKGTGRVRLARNRAATLYGYYRSTKAWDLLVTVGGRPTLVVEYKSMSGSEGRNLNNRADEMFGIAEDTRAAQAHGILPPDLLRAFVALHNPGCSWGRKPPVSS
ncbi:MAG: PaeR7I family type II restriction endonuclease, partial [Candidatus Nanopelagicales bacterium]